MTKLTLIANGCSHTAGAEIEFKYQGTSYNNAWPRWLADIKGWNWINIAQSGSSNEFIGRTTVEWLAENLETNKNYKPEDIVVMIMWAGFNRFELFSHAQNRIRSATIGSDVTKEAPETRALIRYKFQNDPEQYFALKSLLAVYQTARILESFGVKYYFANANTNFCTPEQMIYSLKPHYTRIYNAYGEREKLHLGFLRYDDNFWNYMIQKNVPISEHSANGHYGVDGQQAWANRLIEYFNFDDI
jgi:hypothetical protein